MQFPKAEKILHDNNNFNPPPNYYSYQQSNLAKPSTISNSVFAKQQRFDNKQAGSNPGPGHYYNDKAERVRKRIIEQARRKQMQAKSVGGNQSQIKISSIPSIPKKSTTRVYQQLAPGILILHEQQNQGTNIGPGSYNINSDIGHKKIVSHKINPQHRKKIQTSNEPQIKIPTIAQQLRNQKRQLYKKSLVKTTGIHKNMISPSDLCLQVIILREKLLRSQQNPPPGQYYNQKYQTSFQQKDPDLLRQYQLMMGKQPRFKQVDNQDVTVGPGAYQIQVQKSRSKLHGGFIAKGQKQLNLNKNPGPGTYKIQSIKSDPTNPKGNYPPIFGSGSNRFYELGSQSTETPGPGSYKVDKTRQKKPKYIKIKKNFYQSQIVKPAQQQQIIKSDLISLTGDKSRSHQNSFFNKRNRQKNNHYFSSKVERFSNDKSNQLSIGPGQYSAKTKLLKDSFNRNQDFYTGSKQPRFDDSMVRPHLGPGAYFQMDSKIK